VAGSIRPHHFGDLASLMVGKVHCNDIYTAGKSVGGGESKKTEPMEAHNQVRLRGGNGRRGGATDVAAASCAPGPDYYIPSNRSLLTKDEVLSYAGLVAIFRSSWWPPGVLTEMDEFQLALMTNDRVLRITMLSTNNQQVR
jgi:hypothetical protein